MGMDMGEQRITYYIERYLKGDISHEERQILASLLDDPTQAEELARIMSSSWNDWQDSGLAFPEVAERIKLNIASNAAPAQPSITISPTHRVPFLRRSWFKYAAAVILLLSGAATWWIVFHTDRKSEKGSIAANRTIQAKDIQPATNRAILTVGNDTVDLSSDKTGVTIGSAITYNDGSSIEGLTQDPALITYNTISTPRGGQYQAVLPDGTKVWLNAASHIRFPSKFSGNKREVEVNGEVYMEVAKDPGMPFTVLVNGVDIHVLGTSFNINAYSNEPVLTTTLLEGSVRLAIPHQDPVSDPVILKPGQQAVVAATENNTEGKRVIKIKNADIENVMAWRNGLFNFNQASIPEVMRQLERWYNVDVIYEGAIPAFALEGKMQRDLNLAEILELLGKMKVKYKVAGREVIIKEK